MRSGTTLFLVFLFIQINSVISQKPVSFQENGKWGFKVKGKTIVPAIYNSLSDFSNGYARVSLNDQYGYIDIHGKVIIPIIYEDAYVFVDKLAPVKKKGLWGFVDLNGKPATEFIYTNAWPFYSPLGATVLKEGKMGCLDKTGKIFIPLEYENVGSFSEGLLAVQKNGLYGYVDVKNVVKIPFQFQEAYDFVGENAFAMHNGKYGMIDKTGQWIIPAEFGNFELIPSMGLAIMNRDGKYEIWNNKGMKLTENIYTNYQEDLGYLRVNINEFQGLLNANGEVILSCEYSFMEITEYGTIEIGENGKMGIYDIKSKKITAPIIYDQIGYPEDGICYLTLDNKQGLYDVKKKKIMIEPLYDGIEEHSMGYYLVFNDGKVGLINPDGNLLLDCKYSYIDIQKKKTILAVTETEINEYYTLDGKKIDKK